MKFLITNEVLKIHRAEDATERGVRYQTKKGGWLKVGALADSYPNWRAIFRAGERLGNTTINGAHVLDIVFEW